MNIDNVRLSVVLPKRSASSLSQDKQNEDQSMGEHKGHGSAGCSWCSSGSLYSAQEDSEKGKVEEKKQREDQGTGEQRPEAMAVQDSP